MKKSVKKYILFVDAMERGAARMLTDDGIAFEFPVALLPRGTHEGCRISFNTEIVEDDNDTKDEINYLLDDLGDNP